VDLARGRIGSVAVRGMVGGLQLQNYVANTRLPLGIVVYAPPPPKIKISPPEHCRLRVSHSSTVESLAVASALVPRLLGGVLRILALYRLARIVYRRAAERRSSETLEQRSSAVPECWCSGTPEQRSVGEREHSDAPRRPCRILALHPGNSAEPRSIAAPEQWRAECRSNGAPEQQGTGAAELRSAGAAERRSSGTPEQWSAEAPEQQSA